MSFNSISSLGLGSGFDTNIANDSKACDHVLAVPKTRPCTECAKMRAMSSGFVLLSDLHSKV